MKKLALLPILLLAGIASNSQSVVLFSDENLKGRQLLIEDDWTCENTGFCSDIESIYVPEGWEVWAYEYGDFSGDVLRLTSTWKGNGSDDWKWRNDIGSIRIVRKYWTSPYGPRFVIDKGVGIFGDTNFEGKHLFIDKDWSCENTGYCSDIESIRVPKNWTIWVFEESDFSGDFMILNDSWTGNGPDDWKWRNDIRSVRIMERNDIFPLDGEAPFLTSCSVVTLYEHDFSGQRLEIRDSWSATRENQHFLNDMISSIHIPSGVTVIVYEHSNFEGKSMKLTDNWRTTGVQDWWNDRISSVKVVRD